MTAPDEIGWGSYNQYEGPFFRGRVPFDLTDADRPAAVAGKRPPDPRTLAVITATEGGRYDAINMYDRCIVSVGLIQWCEAGQYGVSNLLGAVAQRDRALLLPLSRTLDDAGADFGPNKQGKWRFSFDDERGEVDTAEKQRQLFLGGSSGLKGGWTDAQKAHAKRWAAALADVLAQPGARSAQVAFTLPKIEAFATPEAKRILFDDALPDEGWVGALRAAFLSFAVNLPAVASAQLKLAAAEATAPKWSAEYCDAVIRRLTLGPKIAIYPHRYRAIRPVLERLYGVTLPELDAASEHEEEGEGGELGSVQAVQRALVAMGYDLGPAGADGKAGQKTRVALMDFQRKHQLEPDGVIGPKTKAALAKAAQEAQGSKGG